MLTQLWNWLTGTAWRWIVGSFQSLYELIRCAVKRAFCDWMLWLWGLLLPMVQAFIGQLPSFERLAPDLTPVAGWVAFCDRFFPIDFWLSMWAIVAQAIVVILAIRWLLRVVRGG
jgi:hypothetical protein